MLSVFTRRLLVIPALLALAVPAYADNSFAQVAADVNKRVVKVFGAGGFRGITHYCSGVLVSPDGYILTVYSPTLDSQEVRVHLFDGSRHDATLVAAEPQMDVALLKIKDSDKLLLGLPYFDLSKPIPEVAPGNWVLALSNLFEIATRDEPVSVQRGVIAAIAPLATRRGADEMNYKGTVYILDAITNNPGSHGGALVNRKGELIGLIGKELRNSQTFTWVNYGMPLKDLTKFVEEAKAGKYKPIARPDPTKFVDKGAKHGIQLVFDAVDRTPPYIEAVQSGSPAAKAGLKPDDLIVFLRVPGGEDGMRLEERVIGSVKVFKEVMGHVDPGNKVTVIVRRGNQLLSFDVTTEGTPKPPMATGPGK